MTLTLTPIAFDQACLLVRAWHRHHRPPAGHKYSIGLAQDGELVGAIIVGRPVARHYDDGQTLEVLRSVVADETPNGNSMLYGAAWRAAKALGYSRLITYTQAGETGASLRGAGWRVVAQRAPRAGWDTPSRRRLPRGRRHPTHTLGGIVSTSRAAVTVICDWCQARFSTTRTTTKSARNDAQRKGWRVSRYGPGGQVGASSDPERPDQCPECQPEKHAKPQGGLF